MRVHPHFFFQVSCVTSDGLLICRGISRPKKWWKANIIHVFHLWVNIDFNYYLSVNHASYPTCLHCNCLQDSGKSMNIYLIRGEKIQVLNVKAASIIHEMEWEKELIMVTQGTCCGDKNSIKSFWFGIFFKWPTSNHLQFMIMQGENLYQCNALFNDAESTTKNDLKHSNDLD